MESSEARIVSNERLKGDYWRVRFDAPAIAKTARAGQFAHVRIPTIRDRILRRPFSICDASGGVLTVVYKIVGAGTAELARLKAGDSCDIMGPLGNPYSVPGKGSIPVIVAGGYGSAATLLLARRSAEKGILLIGARSSEDLILADEYRTLGFEVREATDDGSQGFKGFVTGLFEKAVGDAGGKDKARVYGCGPTGMLLALGRKALAMGVPAELSLDHQMCCGVGACFACVVKVKDESSKDGWRYARTCKEGPVFKAEEVWYNG